MRPPAATAWASTASTSAGDPTLWASVMPPQPPASVTAESSASAARSHSDRIIGPAWKNTTPLSSATEVWGVQPMPV